jgi:phenylacetate-CoA ligase
MNLADAAVPLYFRLPVWAQNAAISAYGWRLRRLRYGPEQQRTLQALRDSQWTSRADLERLQCAELTRVVKHAARTVPLYVDLGQADSPIESLEQLRDLPVLEKDSLRGPRATITSSDFGGHSLLEIHTGGTTGKPLTIYCDRGTLQRNYAFFSRFLEWTGVPSRPRVATFAGRTLVPPDREGPPFWRHNAAMKQLLLSSYHLSPASVPEYARELARFAPQLIDSYPSSLEPIARYLDRTGEPEIRPTAVITSSETLDDSTRRLLKRVFGCQVFDHYGAAEMAAFVSQCEHGSYHVNPEFGVVEVLKDGVPVALGESGEIVATGFINPVMPLIRYATGDWAVQGPDECGCGRQFPTLVRIEGRLDDVIETPDGRLVGRLDPIFKSIKGIRETRIVQDRPDHVRVEIIPDETFDSEDARMLRQELARRLGPSMAIDIVPVERIPRTGRGKLRTVVNELRETRRSAGEV